MTRHALLAIATALVLTVPGIHAATTDPNPNQLEIDNGHLSRDAAEQGMVLLENHPLGNKQAALPLPRSGNIALFGAGSFSTVQGGTGSGAVNNRYLITVQEGLLNAGYTLTQRATGRGALDAASVRPTAPTDTAIVTLARNSGEGADRSAGKGDYRLTDVEWNNLALIGQTYERVIVVLNVGGIVDTSFFAQINAAHDGALDALLLMSQAGQQAGNALAAVLDGSVTPSGRLTDTWASKYSYYPASATFAGNDGNTTVERYSEGLYVGYRYFDSLYSSLDPANPAGVVNYPFGYGLSYTNFSIQPRRVTTDARTVAVTARVTNTGSRFSGREVVQVYYSAPQSGLDKPYQNLAGYLKTDDLAPGASQEVVIRFDLADLASYDPAKAAYTLEPGDYLIRVGDSSRSTHVAAKIRLDGGARPLQLATELNSTIRGELTSDPDRFYVYPGQSAEIANAPVLALSASSIPTATAVSPHEQSVPVATDSPYFALDGSRMSSTTALISREHAANWAGTGAPYRAKPGETPKTVTTDDSKNLRDVARGDYSLEQFVAGLSVTKLANIVEGSSAVGFTGTAGYTTANYESLGLPGMTLSDGPAGLRLRQRIDGSPTRYQYATAWPIGTMLAQTWDPALVERVGRAIGREMAQFGVTLWLAPGMNIHRDPLGGRNFEYYSEDPLVSGLTAAAATRGVQDVPGRGVTLKHFFGNNQETARFTTNSLISERAAREIYLRAFEIAVKDAEPAAIMTSYNRVNDGYTAANYDLNTDILRGEWGFDGLVMTDWGAGPRAGAAGVFYSGNDLIEPGLDPGEVGRALSGTLRLGDMQRSATRVIEVALRLGG
jgi:beta-glucosidase